MMDGDNGPALKLERWEEPVSHHNESQDHEQSASQPQQEEKWGFFAHDSDLTSSFKILGSFIKWT